MRPLLVLTTAAALTLGALGSASAGAGAAGRPAAAPHVAPVAASVAAQVAGAKAGATTLGQSGGSLVVCSGAGATSALLATEAAGLPTYVAPANGVITSITHVANNVPGQVRAIAFGPATVANHSTVYAKSPKLTVAVNLSNTLPVRVPMRAGDKLGIGTTASGMACLKGGAAGDLSWLAPFDPDLSSDFASTTFPPNVRPNISGVLEPDVDADGFGDVSQDACPRSALSQVACPDPDTTITKRPKRFRSNPKVKIKFDSTVPGSTFECSLDGRKFRTCTSPFKKKLGIGTHKVRVRAVSPAGITDPKPAKVRVTITR